MWDNQANGFGGPDIDDQLEFRRLFDGKVPGLGALSNSGDVAGGAAEKIGYAHTVAHESSVLHVIRCVIHCRDTAFYGDVRHLSSIGEKVRTGQHQSGASTAVRRCFERGLDILRAQYLDDLNAERKRACRTFYIRQSLRVARCCRCPDDDHASKPRNGVLEYFK